MTQPVFRSPKGIHDILPEDHQYMTYIKKAVRHRARQAGYKRIEPPIFEERGVFERGIGAHTDVVEKELFAVSRKGAEDIADYALRPEFTAGICRSYIQHNMYDRPQPVELYAIGPCFRYDRPQKGRYRESKEPYHPPLGTSVSMPAWSRASIQYEKTEAGASVGGATNRW
jgi:histidyl-tRNA synthetase